MKVLWNQVKKDVRSIRLILAVWLVMEIGLAVLVGSGVDARFVDDRTIFDRTIFLINTEHRVVLYLATAIFTLVAIALVQADRLVGTTAFWLTRPVGRSMLLASKAIVAVVFLVLVPLALDAIVFFASGVTPPDLWQALAQQLAGQVLFLLPVVAVAALTPNIGRFVLVCVIVAGAWSVLDAGVRALGLTNRPVGAFVAGRFVALTLMAIASLVVIVHQYRTRRTRRSSLVGGAGIAGMLVVFLTWPWPMPASPLPAVDVRQFDPATVTLSIGASQLQLHDWTTVSSLQADGTAQGVLPGFQVRQEDVRTTLRFADGTLVSSDEQLWGKQDVLGDQLGMLRRALGPVRVVYSRPAGSPPSPLNLLRIPARTVEEHGNQAATCKADIVLGVWTDRVAAEIPARRGARFWYGGFWRGDIVDVALTAHGVWMRTRESGVRLRSDDLAPRYGYVLLNKSRGEVIVGHATQTGVFWPTTYPQVPSTGTLDVRHAYVDFSAYHAKDREFSVNQAWLDGATLVIVETSLIGTFTRSVDFGDIVLASLLRR